METVDVLRLLNIASSLFVMVFSLTLVISTYRSIIKEPTPKLRSTASALLSLFILMMVISIMNATYLGLVYLDVFLQPVSSLVGNVRILIENISTIAILITLIAIRDGKL